jgi:hypothetical protein
MESLHDPNHCYNMRSAYDLMLHIEPLGLFILMTQFIRNSHYMKLRIPQEGVVH